MKESEDKIKKKPFKAVTRPFIWLILLKRSTILKRLQEKTDDTPTNNNNNNQM